MAENVEFKLEVDLRQGGKEEVFNSVESFSQWLEAERKFWNWGNVLKSPMDQNACSALNSSNGKLNSIQNVFSTIVNNVHNPGAFQQGVNSLKNTLRDYYKNNSILHSSNPRAKFINEVKEKDPIHAAYILKYFQENRFDFNNKKEFEGAFAALLFEHGVKSTGKAELLALEELRNTWQAHLNHSKDELNKTKAQYDNILKEYVDQKEDQKKTFQNLLDTSKKDHQAALDETKKKLHELMELYKSKLGLHSAIEYWGDKAKSNRTLTICFSIAVLVCFALAAWGLFVSINMFIGNDTVQSVKVWKLATLLLGATIGVWILRVLIRLLLSNYHLMSDANERKTMLLTYLALQQENKLPAGDSMHLILQALFRPTSMGIIKDDAVPPFMAAWLKKTTGDD